MAGLGGRIVSTAKRPLCLRLVFFLGFSATTEGRPEMGRGGLAILAGRGNREADSRPLLRRRIVGLGSLSSSNTSSSSSSSKIPGTFGGRERRFTGGDAAGSIDGRRARAVAGGE